MTGERPTIDELRRADYVKSTYSPDMENCVRVALVAGWIGIQDDKQYARIPRAERATLGCTVEKFAAFVRGG